MAANQWTPQRTRCGLTLWTYRASDKHRSSYIMVRRDNDGKRVTRASLNRPLIGGRMPDVIAAFDALPAYVARVLIDFDENTTCAGCRAVANSCVDAIHAALEPHLKG